MLLMIAMVTLALLVTSAAAMASEPAVSFDDGRHGRRALQGILKNRRRRSTVNKIAKGVQNVGRAQAAIGAATAAVGHATGDKNLQDAGAHHLGKGAKRAVGGGIVKRATRSPLDRRGLLVHQVRADTLLDDVVVSDRELLAELDAHLEEMKMRAELENSFGRGRRLQGSRRSKGKKKNGPVNTIASAYNTVGKVQATVGAAQYVAGSVSGNADLQQKGEQNAAKGATKTVAGGVVERATDKTHKHRG